MRAMGLLPRARYEGDYARPIRTCRDKARLSRCRTRSSTPARRAGAAAAAAARLLVFLSTPFFLPRLFFASSLGPSAVFVCFLRLLTSIGAHFKLKSAINIA